MGSVFVHVDILNGADAQPKLAPLRINPDGLDTVQMLAIVHGVDRWAAPGPAIFKQVLSPSARHHGCVKWHFEPKRNEAALTIKAGEVTWRQRSK